MTFLEARNAIITGLESHIGCPVVLSDQIADMPGFPYCYYSVLATRSAGHAFGMITQSESRTIREEPAEATMSFTFCSENREDGVEYIFGEDEAINLCELGHGFFLLNAHGFDLESGNVVVRDVGAVTNRSGFLLEDTIRRYGFDVRIAYTRTDEMAALPVKKAGKIIHNR
ncbi:MAG: hypothetical protein IJ799_03000 [Bacteroidales bacterium]|nr:hypothetical protein [Bacteroidales bacterium]